ncbi:MAG: hypothetical protein MUE49_00290 [Rhodospirillales bacterium]|jgi:hypothetical protein|nr:hypothetical protein [Rhodospirillales bacterium]
MTAPPTPGDRRDWLDDAKNVRTIVRALIAISAIAFLGSALYASHGFAIEDVFGFYGVYGFVACVALVMIAKAMRRVLMRPESYYDDDRY